MDFVSIVSDSLTEQKQLLGPNCDLRLFVLAVPGFLRTDVLKVDIMSVIHSFGPYLNQNQSGRADRAFWLISTAAPLDILLQNCGYTKEQRSTLADWYSRYIIPALGPSPRPGIQPLFEPCLVFDGSACELSMNWKEFGSARTVRFTIEATAFEAGTFVDPFNQNATQHLLNDMAKEVSKLSLTKFNHFAKEFFLPSEVATELKTKLPLNTPLSQVWVAFDLLRDQVIAKVYFIPILKWLYTGIPTRKLVKDAILTLDEGFGSYENSLHVLDNYLDSFESGTGPHVEMMAIDCFESSESRVKIYLSTGVNTLASAKLAYTMGNKLVQKSTTAALEALSQLWTILFKLEALDCEDARVLPAGSGCGLAIEMKPGAAQPEVKIHIPVRKTLIADSQICDALSTWFASRGHLGLADTYKNDLAAVFPNHDLENGHGTHTFISFAYSEKTGVYMTMYYSVKTLGEQAKDHWDGYDNIRNARKE